MKFAATDPRAADPNQSYAAALGLRRNSDGARSLRSVGCPPTQNRVDDLQELVGSGDVPLALSPASTHPLRHLGHVTPLGAGLVRPGGFGQDPPEEVVAVAAEVPVVGALSALIARGNQAGVGADLVDVREPLDGAEFGHEDHGGQFPDPRYGR